MLPFSTSWFTQDSHPLRPQVATDLCSSCPLSPIIWCKETTIIILQFKTVQSAPATCQLTPLQWLSINYELLKLSTPLSDVLSNLVYSSDILANIYMYCC